MFFLFSGEGVTDMGSGKSELAISQGENYFPGPMAVIADHVIEKKLGFSALDTFCCGYISEHYLSSRAVELKAAKKSLGLPGKKRGKEVGILSLAPLGNLKLLPPGSKRLRMKTLKTWVSSFQLGDEPQPLLVAHLMQKCRQVLAAQP